MYMQWIILLVTISVTVTANANELPKICDEGTWVGPMHPQIRGEEGDRCPICGMDLVPDPACFPDEEGSEDASEDREVLYWHDPMVPDVKFDQPGPSPFMDMDLVPVYADNLSRDEPGLVSLSPRFQQALGVRTTPVQSRSLGRTVRAYADVVPNTRNEWMLHMRAEGWVMHLATDAVGDAVQQGDLLFTYYSPELLDAQTDFLLGERTDKARERLELFGMSDQAIQELADSGEVMRRTPFYAPMDGTIIELPIREGSLLKAGQLALAVQDFSTVWVDADVRIEDLPGIHMGQSAQVIIPQTQQTIASKVDFIHPVANPNTRRATVRLLVEQPLAANSAMAPASPVLRPGTYVDVVFEPEVMERLLVPMEAVLYDTEGAVVFEALGEGKFRPVSVDTGITSQGFTEILAGLSVGQEVVVSGQFMIDADSSLRSGMDQMNHTESDSAPESESLDHSSMDHSSMDHSSMDHSSMDHSSMDHSSMDHSSMDHSSMDHSSMDHSSMDHSSMDHSSMDQPKAPSSDPEKVNKPEEQHHGGQ